MKFLSWNMTTNKSLLQRLNCIAKFRTSLSVQFAWKLFLYEGPCFVAATVLQTGIVTR